MIPRLLAITGCLTAGHAVLFGVYWLMLSVPESNVFMLSASALTIAAGLLIFGWVEGLGLLAWRSDTITAALPRRAIRTIPAVWLGAVLFVVLWFLVAYAGTSWHAHRGETDAWLMSKFGWADTTRLHTIVGWVLAFVSRVLFLSIAVEACATLIDNGWRGLRGAAWLRRALGPRRVLAVTGILAVFFWLPWQAVDYRPHWLEPNWQETLFVSAKLGVLYLLGNLGWALVLGSAKADRRPSV